MKNQTRILIVDDEPDMCWALENILHPKGYQTMVATTGQEALELAEQEEPPSIALIDVVLPDINGIELAALIREVLPEIVIIVISGRLCEGDKIIEEGLRLGTFSGFLSKPFELAKVRLVVKKAVSGP
jgi:CheY-like chemotaxis protein